MAKLQHKEVGRQLRCGRKSCRFFTWRSESNAHAAALSVVGHAVETFAANPRFSSYIGVGGGQMSRRPGVQAAVLIKVFERRENGTFAALAMLYRRNGEGTGSVQDVVSFGTREPNESVTKLLRANITFPVKRSRSTNWALQRKNPPGLTPPDRASITRFTVPASDIFVSPRGDGGATV
jgi:hypothetical protein